MYQALYRKYRPKTFSDVVGQEHITQTLKNQIDNNRATHAYLFTGTRGTGKTSCAKILARAINCENPILGDPCNECNSCISILSESAVDVAEIDAASNNKVDDIRDILEETRYMPASLKKRVYIIDEVHMLTTQAFNALLKTLEEPPPHVLFILATTETHKVLPTILSRCQRYDFRRITMNSIAKHLINVSEKEGFTLLPDASDIIAKVADGGLRDALSILDRCMIGGENEINASMVCERIGSVDFLKLLDLAEDVINYKTIESITKIQDMYNEGIELSNVIEQFLTLSRDMLLFNITKERSVGILYNNEKFYELSEKISEGRLTSFIDTISSTINTLQKSQNKKIDTELCIIKLSKNISNDNSDIESRFKDMENRILNIKPQIIVQETQTTVSKEPVKPIVKRSDIKPLEPNDKGIEDIERYKELLRNLKYMYKNFQLILILENTKAIFYKDRIYAYAKDPITFDLISSVDKKVKIGNTASELFNQPVFFDVFMEDKKHEIEECLIDSVLEIAKNENIEVEIMED